jgi:antitoxin CptB
MESIAKLRWRCRRGTKELDYLLTAYLDQYYQQASEPEQACFVELLTLQDTQLIALLLEGKLSGLKERDALVKKIHCKTI